MSVRRHLRDLEEACAVVKNIVLYRYPSFVYGRETADEIPIFGFHSVEPESFETMLRFLKENNYHTLTAEELYDLMSKRRRLRRGRSIVLTFDDGMGSVWSVGYPLLNKYGFKATVFLIPGLIKHRKRYHSNLDDVWAGQASIGEITRRDCSEEPFTTWDEIETMHESGVIDFQSHTLTHSLICISPAVVDFLNSFCISKYHQFEFTMIRGPAAEGNGQVKGKFGAPIYAAEPRMSGRLRYTGDPRLDERCIGYVEENGGEMFFGRKDWRRMLRCIVEEYRIHNSISEKYETVGERDRAIMYELAESKKVIEEHLPGKKVCHLSYPWGVGSPLSMKLSQDAGYCTNFWGKIDNRLTNKVGQDPFKIARIGEDFVFLLCGAGRSSLGKVLVQKSKRRLKEGSRYLAH